MEKHNFLVELGVEEMPPKSLQILSQSFSDVILEQLKLLGINFLEVDLFATPRRLAVLIKGIDVAQPNQVVKHKGPSVKAAYDQNKQPTKAAIGFVRSKNITFDQLSIEQTPKGKWLFFYEKRAGKKTKNILPDIVSQSLNQLPIVKKMRWGKNRKEFVRPVHWLIMMMNSTKIDCKILGLNSSNKTYGHRYHANFEIEIKNEMDYAQVLREKGKVIASFQGRLELIRKQIYEKVMSLNAHIEMDESLLKEVTALTEWPVVLSGKFDKKFLDLPAEILISSMKDHQRYFYLTDKFGAIIPYFITVANIESLDSSSVIKGNERVIHPRLSDAEFFFDQDKKSSLYEKRQQLKNMIFHKKLGNLYNKTERIKEIAIELSSNTNEKKVVERASILCKSDLCSSIIQEFPELQGIMGKYYAEFDGESMNVSIAIGDLYKPRFANDDLPSSLMGSLLSISDRIDTIVGIFGINLLPTGSKDPFALRRAVLGIIKIIIYNAIKIDMSSLINKVICLYQKQEIEILNKENINKNVYDFILERLKFYYQEQNISTEIFLSVKKIKTKCLYDFHLRVKAVFDFVDLPESKPLAQTNKRVKNILSKERYDNIPESINSVLLQDISEKTLVQSIIDKRIEITPMLEQQNYQQALLSLVSLKTVIDDFFDQVMVNDENKKIRLNRYAILKNLRSLFKEIADISMLS